MSLPRTAAGLASSSTSAFTKFAAGQRSCSQCLRTFSSTHSYRQSSKRQLQTATAYRPHTLNPSVPPRNFPAQETSITSNTSEVNKAGPPPPAPAPAQSENATQSRPGFSVSEGEAQKSKPAPAAPAPGKSIRPRRYNFGPRKATIKISQSAVKHLRALLDQPEPKLIRIGTKAKGCSGLAYHLEYVDKPSALDEQVEQDGVKVLIDNKALLNIIGSEMDWLDDKLNQRFVFKNPNATEQCGCGESFSVS